MSKEIVVQTDMLSSLSRDYKNYSDNIYDIYKAGQRKIERELESILSNYSDYYSVKSRVYELQRMLAENEQEIRAVQNKADKISSGLQKAAQSYIESEEREKRLIASQQGKMIKLDEVNRLSRLNISINANLKNQDVNDADPALGIGYMAFDGAIEYTLDSGTKETISGMSKKTSNVKSNILGNISNTVNNVKTSIGDFIGGFKKTAVRISESMQAFWDNFKNECLKLFKKAEAVFSDFGHKARDATEYLANKAQSLAKLIAENKDAIWDGLKTVGIVILDVVQFVLDIVGLIPAVGEIADAINGCIYLLRGDMVSAGLSFAACIPFAGWAATLGKFAKRGLEFADKIGDIGKLIDRVKDFGKYFDKIKDVGNAVLKYSDNVIQLVRKKGSDVWSYLSKFNLVDKAKGLVSKVVQKGIDINSYLEKQVARLKLNLGDWWDAQYRLGIVPPETAKWLDWMDSRAGKEVGETIPDIEKTVDGVEHTGVSKVDDVGTPPRYGERQISDEEYNILRNETPTQNIRDQVNKGHNKNAVTQDKALPGKTFKGTLEADHIVSMDKITKMDGFGKLTKEQQLEVLNNPDNFIGLSKSANTSKQSKSFEDWTHYKKGKSDEIEVDPDFRRKMIEKEKELERKLQEQIDNFNKQNSKTKNKGDD